jgi:hypothetical protein
MIRTVIVATLILIICAGLIVIGMIMASKSKAAVVWYNSHVESLPASQEGMPVAGLSVAPPHATFHA